jgi:hypothetical protein
MHSIQFIGGGVDFHISNKLSDIMFFCGKGHYIEVIYRWIPFLLCERSHIHVLQILWDLYMHEFPSSLSMNYKITTSKSEVQSHFFPLHSVVPHHVMSILQFRVEVTPIKWVSNIYPQYSETDISLDIIHVTHTFKRHIFWHMIVRHVNYTTWSYKESYFQLEKKA